MMTIIVAIIIIIIIATQTALLCVLWVCSRFLSASLFVGRPSHLFHSHICDLLGSDWYGNIIIQAWILSLSSLTLPTLHLSYLFCHIHISLPQLSLSSLHSKCSSRQDSQLAPSFILYFNTTFITCLMTLHFFLHWVIHLEARSRVEQHPYLLRERWRASHSQSKGVHR